MDQQPDRVTLADVAARVGVSGKSVSNVVNGTGRVSSEVRERILRAIDELGYRPNLAARQLRNGRSGLIALVLPDLREPYFAEFASQFVGRAQRRGLTVLVSQTGGDHDAERLMLEGEGMPALDGIVMSPLRLSADDVRDRRATTPLVVIGEEGEALVGGSIHHVGIDNITAAAAATEHLLARGRRRIAAIGVQHTGPSATSQRRFEGYRRALEARGIPIDDALLAPVAEFNRAEGSRAAQQLLDGGAAFDGLFCFSDTLALGALHALGHRGVAVPDAVEVIGFDGIEEGRYIIPTFATVDPRVDEASDTILDILARTPAPPGAHHPIPFSIDQR